MIVVWYADGSRGLVIAGTVEEAASFAWRSGDVVAWFPTGVPA